jgi:hypothetical protein
MKPQTGSLLYQEIQALALKSRKLRRMNFGNCLPRRRPKDTFDVEGQELEKDPGCEIVAAVLPLCRGRLTNVNWIVLSGIELGETDLDELSMPCPCLITYVFTDALKFLRWMKQSRSLEQLSVHVVA